jgi:hypothetical protein
MEDKRRYKSRTNTRGIKPDTSGLATGNIAADGYEVRHREPYNQRRSPEIWADNSNAAHSLRSADFDSFMDD